MEATLVPQNKVSLAGPKAGPVAAYLAGLGAGSRRGQESALRAALAAVSGRETGEIAREEVGLFPWHQLTAAHVAAMRAALEGRHTPAYANKVLSAIRGVLRSAWRLGLLTRDEYARAADVPPVRGQTLPAGRDLSAGEIGALMRACGEDRGPAGVRDAALIALGVTCGLRIAEASGLDLADYDLEDGRLVVRGKGHKERTAFAVNGAKDALDDWLSLRRGLPGSLFYRVRKGGAIVAGRVSPTSFQRMLAKRAEEAGIAPFTWHDMRRTAAGDLLDVGTDLVTVQKLLGHADPRTTARYDRRPEETKRQAVAKLHVPYRRRRG